MSWKIARELMLIGVAICWLVGCRGASPEEVGSNAAGFAADVLYNSAGAQNQANRENAYPRPCQNCEGSGYHSRTPESSERIQCPACMGRGWN